MAHLFCRGTNGFIEKWKTAARTRPLVVYAVAISCVFAFCVYGTPNICSYSSSSSDYKSPMVFALKANENHLQQNPFDALKTSISAGARRLLGGGPGSSPPRCTRKCGRCMPCKPVHVTVPPGTPVVAEYYPEAWRCKCGNRLYMP